MLQMLYFLLWASVVFSIPGIAILGWGSRAAREAIRKAAALALEKRYVPAKAAVIYATRLDGALRKDPVVIAFYEKLASEADISPNEAEEISAAVQRRPLTFAEKAIGNPLFLGAIGLLLFLSIASRFLSLFH